MAKTGREYSSKNFKNLVAAYNQYQKDRLSDTTNPTLAPRNRFAQIWGWTKTPGKDARAGLNKK